MDQNGLFLREGGDKFSFKRILNIWQLFEAFLKCKVYGKTSLPSFRQLFMPTSVTRLGDFWKFLVTNIPSKVPKIFGDILGYLGSGCGSVGRAVASNSKGLQFKSSHQQTFILNIFCQDGENRIWATFYANIRSHVSPVPKTLRLWWIRVFRLPQDIFPLHRSTTIDCDRILMRCVHFSTRWFWNKSTKSCHFLPLFDTHFCGITVVNVVKLCLQNLDRLIFLKSADYEIKILNYTFI